MEGEHPLEAVFEKLYRLYEKAGKADTQLSESDEEASRKIWGYGEYSARFPGKIPYAFLADDEMDEYPYV